MQGNSNEKRILKKRELEKSILKKRALEVAREIIGCYAEDQQFLRTLNLSKSGLSEYAKQRLDGGM